MHTEEISMSNASLTRTDGGAAGSRRTTRTRTSRRRRFLVEALEDRRLLTTLFTPSTAETASDGGGYKLGTRSWGMPIYTIYWGSWWTNTSAGQALQTQVQNSLNNIFYSSGYLSGLHQYGIPDPAGVPGSGTVEVNNTSDPTTGFSRNWLQNTIAYAIDNQGLPDTDTYNNEGLYVVFTPPGILCWDSSLNGDHANQTVWDPFPDQDTRHWAWVGDFGGLNAVTTVLTHEVVEAMTDPDGDAIQVAPRDNNNWNEVCDNEAQAYSAFVNGYQVQSFWSQSDGNYAVYDGNSQTVTDNHGNLVVNGDQLGPSYNDTISVDLNGQGGVLVNLNGEVFSYPAGQISQVTINPGGGTDTINILNTTSGDPVTINEGGGNDSVYVSPGDRSLDHIQGKVTVKGGSGYDTLTIDDQNEFFSFLESYTLTASTFTRANSAPISYSGMNVVTVNGSGTSTNTFTVQGTESLFTTNLNVDSTSSANTVYIQGTGFWGTLNIASDGRDAVNVGSNGSVQGIFGTVNIDNPPNYTTLTIDDSADTTGHSNVVLGTFTPWGDSPWGSVTGLAPGSINYEYADTSSVTITTGTAADTINVHATGVTTNLSSGGGADTVSVGNAGSAQGIVGTLYIKNPPNFTRLTVDDSLDGVGRSVTLSTFTPGGDTPWASIAGLSPAAIFYRQADVSSPVSLSGGPGGNSFTVITLPTQTVDLSTGGGNDAVNLQSTSGTLVLNGQGGTNTLVGPNAAETWNITGFDSGNVGNVTFSNVQNVTGGSASDTFVMGSSGELWGRINGGGGTNTLVGPNIGTNWYVTGASSGAVAATNFTAIANLTGGSGNDTFQFSNNGAVTGAINGGGGSNTLSYALYATGVTVNLATGTATGTSSIASIQDVTGSPFNDHLTGGSAPCVLGSSGGSDVLAGGAGNATFIMVATQGMGTTITGGAGLNTLKAADIANTWTLAGAGAGNLNGIVFTGIANLSGGAIADTFKFKPGSSVLGKITGGGGTDTLNYSAFGAAISVNLQSSTATATGGFAAITALIGNSSPLNVLKGANSNNTWLITGPNAGSVNNFAFSAIANITGGTKVDAFVFSNGQSISGKIDGGTGGDWLDYAKYSTAITVNLASGTATGVGNGVANIQDVRGGSGANTLTGNSSGNILIGGAGTVTINGGAGRSILIAEEGAGNINGGSGSDILIGAKTSYDTSSLTNDIALEAILTEWQSGNSYSTRVSNIKNGLGLTAGNKLRWGYEVTDNNAANVLTGFPTPDPPISNQVGDWFFAGAGDVIKKKESYEVVN
jgi:hypothetical protein